MNNNQNKIQNPESQVPKTPQMNDRDFLNDILSYEKYMTASYSTAMNEASHDALYQEIHSIFDETKNMQRELYELMFQKGWYALTPEQPQKLQQAAQQFTGYMSQFPHNPPTQ
ncbi:spore coat protein [Fictibacillus sp. WQ 8-8]|uniref:spore coat protein n=1 Tax=unclassified Fictibacillus TaxID=2644029 RepID=UPI0006A7BCB6|nr:MULTISPECIES: spore coat protein [unclassified Fictibacillus]MCQ6266697.1 spore coat protein [Fictibacillus sp. WQ 8-8]MED2971371.1 spore coat protein [Fictibacillus sp. B-59209]SFD55024.1 Coat F domain-containing protein [Bacillus sp. OV194]